VKDGMAYWPHRGSLAHCSVSRVEQWNPFWVAMLKKGPNMEQISGLLGFLEARQCGLTVSLTDMSGG
jgi:hypothetical protein